MILTAFGIGLSLAATGEGGSGTGAVVSQACYMTLLALSGAACLARGLFGDEERSAWLAIGVGLVLWLVGDAAYFVSPSPPTALEDVSFFGFYAAATVGVCLLVRASEWEHREVLDLAIVLAGLASLWSWLVLDRVQPDAQVAFKIVYPFADLALAAVALVLLEAIGWTRSRRWLLLSGGFLAVALADSIYLVQVARDGYISGTVLDFLWPAGTVAVAGGAWLHAPPKPRPRETPSSSYVVGTLAVAGAVAIVLADHVTEVSLLSLGLAGLTFLLGGVRALVTHVYRLWAERSLRAEATHTVQALAHAVDAKDRYTYDHSHRVSQYARVIAEELGFPDERLERIVVAGQLHDVGKIAVPDGILLKGKTLSDLEFEVIKTHPAGGERIVRSVGLADLASWIRHHHERWDGRGYPDGLRGAESPIEARILAVADALDAITSSRSYQTRRSAEAAREEIAANAGTQFDPDVAAVVVALLDDGTLPLPHRR